MANDHRCEAMLGRMVFIQYEEGRGWVLIVAGVVCQPLTFCPFCGVELDKEEDE